MGELFMTAGDPGAALAEVLGTSNDGRRTSNGERRTTNGERS
jgi:hypothetical protein